MRTGLAVVLVLLGAVTAAMGASQLAGLAAIYRQSDLFLTETPETFRGWLKEALATTEPEDEQRRGDLARRIADRLLAIGLEKRRAIAVAMMRRSWWEGVAGQGQAARQGREQVLAGLMQATGRAPAAGDLYLVAASLDLTLLGFTARSDELLRASRVYAPREVPVVLERLRLAPLVWPLLDADHRRLFTADFAVYERALPERAGRLRDDLAAAGVVLP